MAIAEVVEPPALIRRTHIRDRTLSAVAGSPKGYRNVDWPIQIAKENGRLSSVLDRHEHNAEMRWLAIDEYRTHYETMFRSGRDSTDLDIVKTGGNFPISEAIADAMRWIIAVDSRMSKKDRMIVRKLVEGWSLPGAVKHACGEEFRHVIPARVRDALDALIDAVTECKRDGFKYVRLAP